MKRAAVLAGAAFLAVAGMASARAATFTNMSFLVWNGPSSVVGDQAALDQAPVEFPTAVFSYTGPIAFVNDSPPGSSDTFADFFGANASDITGFTSPTGLGLTQFLALTMSQRPAQPGGAINSFFEITGTYAASAAAPITVYHADGASLYSGVGNANTVFSSPSPASPPGVVASTGTLPVGADTPFTLVYVDTNGAPAVLSTAKPTPVPEPSSLALLGGGVALFGLVGFVFARRPDPSGS